MNTNSHGIRVTYWEGGDNSTGDTYEYNADRDGHFIRCSNWKCVGGGFSVWSLIDKVKRTHTPISKERVYCKGREKHNGPNCDSFIEVTVTG